MFLRGKPQSCSGQRILHGAARAASQQQPPPKKKKTAQLSASVWRLSGLFTVASNSSGVIQSLCKPRARVCVLWFPVRDSLCDTQPPRARTHARTHSSPWLLSLDGFFSLQLPAGSEADRAGRLRHAAAGEPAGGSGGRDLHTGGTWSGH